MGIVNREGALYMATGMDNTGLYAGRREAMGIIKAMASQITSFDVFGGLGISAGVAFASAAKDAYNFEKEFRKNMLEVATISAQIGGSLTENMNKVVEITQQIPISAPEAAKALYQIVSAGHDGVAGMEILKVSAKSAVGGLTDTATAADAITTILNAYKLSANKAAQVSDQLFTTVRLGKTDFSQLGSYIAQVAPIAASYGVEIDQVLAAVASLTKSGTPTAQAMTQIRAAIIGTSKVLGDGAFESRTFQEALAEVAAQANGSESKLRELVPEIEAVNGVLGMTGKNAQTAASDLSELQNSTGATEAAFQKMQEDVDNQLKLLSNNIHAALRPMGEAILKEVSSVAQAFNKAFADGRVEAAMEHLGDLIVLVTGALVGYKSSLVAVTSAKTLYHAVTNWIIKAKTQEAVKIVLSGKAYAAEAAVIAKNTGMHVLLTNALKAQTAALAKNATMLLSSPYAWAAVAIAGVGYALYKYATQASAAELAQHRFNDAVDKFNQKVEAQRQKIEQLLGVIQDETETEYAKIKAYEELTTLSPKLTAAYDLEKLKVLELKEANKKLNEERDKANYDNIIKNVNKYTQAVNSLKSAHDWTAKDITEETRKQYSGQVVSKAAKEAQKDLDIWEKALKDYEARKKKAEENSQGIQAEEKALTVFQRKLSLTKELAEAEANLKKLRAPESKASDKEIDAAQKKVDETKAKLKALTGASIKERSDLVKSQQDLSRSILDADLKFQSERIAIMEDGRKKRLAQSELEHQQQKAALEKEYQDTIQKYKDLKQAVPETVETTYKARLQANDEAKKTRDTKIDEDYVKERKEHEEALTAYLLSEEDKRKKAIKDRYDSEREWAKKQLDGGNMSQEEYRTYTTMIDTAEAEDSLNELLEKYQSYTSKRLRIEQDFEKQRKELEKSGASKETLDELSYQEDEALKAVDEQFASRQEEYLLWCNQITNLSLEQLIALLEQAKAELDKMESSGASSSQLAAQRAKVNKLEEQIKNEKISTTPEGRSMEQWQKLRKTLSDVKKEFQGIGDAVGGVAGEFISTAGEIATSTISMIDGIVTLSDSSSTAMIGTAKTASEAIKMVERASVILAIISAALQIANKIASLFKQTDYMAEFRKEMEELNYELELTRLNAEISTDENSIFGDDLWGNAIKNVLLANEVFMKYNDTLKEISDRKKYTGLMGIITENKGLKNSYDSLADSLANMQIQIRHSTWFRSAKYSSLKDAAPELFNADGTVNMNALKGFLGTDTFKKLSEENQKYLQEMSDYWETYQEAVDQVKGYLTNIFGELGNTMSDALVDAFENGTDAAQAFTDSVVDMLETLAKQMIYSITLTPVIENAQKKMLDVTKNEQLNEEQKFNNYISILDELTDGVLSEQERYNKFLEKYQEMAAQKGFDIFTPDEEETERTATAKSGIAASQDSVNELNGNFNAMLIYSEKTCEGVAQVREHLAYIWEIQREGWQNVKVIRDLTEKVEEHTSKIVELTEKIEKNTEDTSDGIDEIKRNGIYIKK